MGLLDHAPRFDVQTASSMAESLYGIRGKASPLPSERDQNFLLNTSSGPAFVLKIANALEDQSLLEAQNLVLSFLENRLSFCPRLVNTLGGALMTEVRSNSGATHIVRLVNFIPGVPLGELGDYSTELLRDLGRKLGQLDRALARFDHPSLHRDFHWDLANGLNVIDRHGPLVSDGTARDFLFTYARDFERRMGQLLPKLRQSIIHNDANDYNVIVERESGQCVTGLIDFGDMVHSYTIADLAVAIAYVVLDKPDPLSIAAQVVAGYHEENPLKSEEFDCLYPLVLLRLCMSVCLAAYQLEQQPDNEYLAISQQAITRTLPPLAAIDSQTASAKLRSDCQTAGGHLRRLNRPAPQTLKDRQRLIGRNVRLAYDRPVKIVRGQMQYLYDDEGREYLDAYNNVAHVGHCHGRVVRAGQDQMAVLNTNTRYLHDLINRYAERLTATLPPSLSVCFFVNSGSEANELALRLARAHTRARDLIVLDHAYHGNTTTLIDISPYKHDGPGGTGPPSWVHKVPLPDTYRGLYRGNSEDTGHKYAGHVADVVSRLSSLSGFIAESMPSVAGQIVFPPDYLAQVYQQVRTAGGICIADEVQTGYGRTGTDFWAFERYGVVPDVVVLGKPIGNGHPIGAVITTTEIAASFDNGMEFFSTFGGNAVSCAVGLAVLDVVLEERLPEHALLVGEPLLRELRELQAEYPIIGDVRGSGFFIGVELVRSQESLEPATEEANWIVNRMREQKILLGTDGPFHNVLKIRPPMPFNFKDARRLVDALRETISELNGFASKV